MFTQCAKCETVFRLSAESLRVAGGQVRCGRCGEVFNALARLAEDSTGFTKGESALDLEARADEILETIVEPLPETDADAAYAVGLPPGVELARLQFIEPVDDELIDEHSLEFTLAPGELDRIFIETRTRPLHLVPTSPPALPPAPPEPPPHPEDAAIAASAAFNAAVNTTGGAVLPQTRTSELAVPEDIRHDLLSSSEFPFGDLQQHAPRHDRLRIAAWSSAGLLLGLLLLVQVGRNNREWLADHMPQLLSGYAPTPDANLSSYQLRQWGVTGEPTAKGALRVRASILNTAAQPQRYPLLRVSLVNRFGGRVGTRDFEPSEYLGRATTRMLAPGERADAVLDILDPGKDAEGFEIDVCVRRNDKSIVCAADGAAQTK